MRETSLPAWLEPLADTTLAQLIDHTLLAPEAGPDAIVRLCDQALRMRLGTVCVNGQWVSLASGRLARGGARREGGVAGIADLLAGNPSPGAVAPITPVAAVVGFPLGASGPRVKAAETLMAVADGATEIDVVQSIGWAKAGEWKSLEGELRAVVDAAQGHAVKVILETAALTEEEVESSCAAAVAAGAAFVKTSTGFHPAGGATLPAVALLRRCVGDRAGVKASGGIRTAQDAVRMLFAGATRIGASGAGGWDPVLLETSVGALRRV